MVGQSRTQTANNESDESFVDPDPFIALRHWGGLRGWGAWLVAHALAFTLCVVCWILLAFAGSLIGRIPLVGGKTEEDRNAAADLSRQLWHWLPVVLVTILVAHLFMVLLLRACRSYIARFSYSEYADAVRKQQWRAERARRKLGQRTFRQLQERSQKTNRRLLGLFVVAAVIGTGLVWFWWAWPWTAGFSMGHRAEIVGLGALSGSALGVLTVLCLFAILVGVTAISWLVLAPERWIGRAYMSWLVDRPPHPPDKQGRDTETPPAAIGVRTTKYSTQAQPSEMPHPDDIVNPLKPPSLGLLIWLSADKFLLHRNLFWRSAPVPCSTRWVPFNRLAAYMLAADVHEMEQRGHIRISIEVRPRWRTSFVRPHRLVRHGRGLRIQQQLYDSPIIDLDARIDDDLTGLPGDLDDMREQLGSWIGNEREDPHWAIMSRVLDEARQMGIIIAIDDSSQPVSGRIKNYDHYKWDSPQVAHAITNGASRCQRWLDLLASKSKEGNLTRHAIQIYRKDLRKIRQWPETESDRLLATVITLAASYIERHRRKWPRNETVSENGRNVSLPNVR